MELMPGYKMTEVGVIPEDWKDATLGELAEIRMCKRIFAEQTNLIGDIPFFKIGTFGRTPDAYISSDLYREYKKKYSFPNKGDVLLSAAGTLGRTVVYDGRDAYFQDSNIVWLDIDHGKITNEYLYQCYQAIRWASPEGSTISRLYNGIIRKTKIPLPPTETEQRAIAQALSDVDALLATLDQVIAKKRDLKQAAMQQLLTGKTRLPGFFGEWDQTTFSDVVRHHAGNSSLIKGKLASTEAAGLFPAYSASGQDVWCKHYEYEGDAVVVSAVGSRCGKAFATSGKWCAIANTHVVWPDGSKVDKKFLGYYIDDEAFWMKSGTGQPFVLFKQSFARPLSLPPLPEQAAIASVLSDIDAELLALECHLEKNRNIKQAMMQELLTGKTRLV